MLRLPAAAVWAIFALVHASGANACGEKFLVPGGAIDAQCVNAPSRTLSILIYGTDASPATAALARKDVLATLKGVGHRVSVCKSADECRESISGGGYDLVLVDASTAREMKGDGRASGKRSTVVMPVIMTRSRAEVSTAKKEFGRVVNADDDGLRILPTINRAASSPR